MNSYQLSKRLRTKREIFYLGAVEQALYYELVAICNEKKWKKEFEVLNQTLYSSLHISEKTLIRARKELVQAGLIVFNVVKGRRAAITYSLLEEEVAEQSSAEQPTVQTDDSTELLTEHSTVQSESLPYYIYNKTINNKSSVPKDSLLPVEETLLRSKAIEKDTKLNFPFLSETFLVSWHILLSTPKWKKKQNYALQLSLNKLSRYDEEFAIELIERAIESNWAGVVYPDTDIQYKKWLSNKHEKSTNNKNNYPDTYIGRKESINGLEELARGVLSSFASPNAQ